MTTSVSNATEVSAPSGFAALNLSEPVLRAIDEVGYTEPTPVQAATYPVAITGRDIIVQARTGTGKTAAFGIPLVDKLVSADPWVQALVLAPTRELAVQSQRELARLAQFKGLHTVAIYGGAPMGRQIEELKSGAQLVSGTPGRVLDHLRRGTLEPSRLKVLVLDEMDEMLSMGFAKELNAILEMIPPKGRRQTMCFSATVDGEIRRHAERHMHEPEMISLSSDAVSAAQITHQVYMVSGRDRIGDLVRVLEVEDPDSAIIFCNMRSETERVALGLKQAGFNADWLNGDLPQKDRERIMSSTREGKLRYLVATDVAARGIDISHLTHVINFTFPESAAVYVHRTGRTGRAGRTGCAISLVGPEELGRLYYLRLEYKISPIERSLPTHGELKTRQEIDRIGLLEAAFADRPNPNDLSVARRLLTHPENERILAGLLHTFFGTKDDVDDEAAAARRSKPGPDLEQAERATRERERFASRDRGRERDDRGSSRDRDRDRNDRGRSRDRNRDSGRPPRDREASGEARDRDARRDQDREPSNEARNRDRESRRRENGSANDREPGSREASSDREAYAREGGEREARREGRSRDREGGEREVRREGRNRDREARDRENGSANDREPGNREASADREAYAREGGEREARDRGASGVARDRAGGEREARDRGRPGAARDREGGEREARREARTRGASGEARGREGGEREERDRAGGARGRDRERSDLEARDGTSGAARREGRERASGAAREREGGERAGEAQDRVREGGERQARREGRDRTGARVREGGDRDASRDLAPLAGPGAPNDPDRESSDRDASREARGGASNAPDQGIALEAREGGADEAQLRERSGEMKHDEAGGEVNGVSWSGARAADSGGPGGDDADEGAGAQPLARARERTEREGRSRDRGRSRGRAREAAAQGELLRDESSVDEDTLLSASEARAPNAEDPGARGAARKQRPARETDGELFSSERVGDEVVEGAASPSRRKRKRSRDRKRERSSDTAHLTAADEANPEDAAERGERPQSRARAATAKPLVAVDGELLPADANGADEGEHEPAEATEPLEGLLYLNLGKRDGLRVPEVARLLRDNCELSRGQIGRIRVRDRYTFVDVPEGRLDGIIATLSGQVVHDKPLAPERAKTAKS